MFGIPVYLSESQVNLKAIYAIPDNLWFDVQLVNDVNKLEADCPSVP